jgi:hypothetical protein
MPRWTAIATEVVLAANFDMASPVAQAVTPNDALIPPPQLQDDRIGFANFWADPIDGKVRAVNYHVTNRQLAGLPPHPSQEVYESLSARALAKIGRGNDVPRDFRGHMIRFTERDAFEPRRSTRSSIQTLACELRRWRIFQGQDRNGGTVCTGICTTLSIHP